MILHEKKQQNIILHLLPEFLRLPHGTLKGAIHQEGLGLLLQRGWLQEDRAWGSGDA